MLAYPQKTNALYKFFFFNIIPYIFTRSLGELIFFAKLPGVIYSILQFIHLLDIGLVCNTFQKRKYASK